MILFFPLAVPPIILHIINVFFIITKRNLHKASYFILISLSISDQLMLISRIIIMVYSSSIEWVYAISDICYYCSLFSTIFISVDRYIAIQYCLFYEQIVTKQKLVLSIIASWAASIFLKLIPMVESAKQSKTQKHLLFVRFSDDVIRYVFMFGSSIILVFLSLRMLHIRRGHIKAIMAMKTHFGADKEKLDKLKNLKQSIKDVFRLNIATAFIVIASNISKLFSGYTSGYATSVLFTVIYFISNPFLYALIMSDLRKHLSATFRYLFENIFRICCKRCRNRAIQGPVRTRCSTDIEMTTKTTVTSTSILRRVQAGDNA